MSDSLKWKNIWKRISEIGVDANQESWINKRIRLSNRLTACIIAIASSYVFVFSGLGVITLAWTTVAAALSFVFVLLLNYYKKYILARFGFVILINNWVLFYCLCIGPETDMQMIFFGLACCPWLLFDTKNWHFILLGVWISIVEFYAFIILNMDPILPLLPEYNHVIGLSFYAVVFIVAMLSVGFLSFENNKHEEDLEVANANLEVVLEEVREANIKLEEQLQLEQENNELQSALELKERINLQLERFTFMIAHDLKSPIYGSRGLLDLIIMELEADKNSQLLEYADLMQQALKHLSSMIDSILEYSRINHNEQLIEEVDTHSLVEQIVNLLFSPHHVQIDIKGELPIIRCNKIKLLQVFQNLISNAIKYNDKEEVRVNIGVIKQSDCYRFYVEDNGAGIDEKDFDRLFGLFEIASEKKNSKDQTGIGLNILKMIVEGQGGKIYVESKLGEGSKFSFDWYSA